MRVIIEVVWTLVAAIVLFCVAMFGWLGIVKYVLRPLWGWCYETFVASGLLDQLR